MGVEQGQVGLLVGGGNQIGAAERCKADPPPYGAGELFGTINQECMAVRDAKPLPPCCASLLGGKAEHGCRCSVVA